MTRFSEIKNCQGRFIQILLNFKERKMGKIYEFEREKLIVGVIYSDPDIYGRAVLKLIEEFGEIEDISPRFSFSREFSDYYDEELGGEGMRVILSFKEPADASRQAEIKELTNAIEAELAVDGCRRVNLDPGFINHGRLMLATTKKAGFRIPLKNGIYTELTLYFEKGEWHHFPWSYRDYKSKLVQDFLSEVRGKYLLWRRAEMKKHPEIYGKQ